MTIEFLYSPQAKNITELYDFLKDFFELFFENPTINKHSYEDFSKVEKSIKKSDAVFATKEAFDAINPTQNETENSGYIKKYKKSPFFVFPQSPETNDRFSAEIYKNFILKNPAKSVAFKTLCTSSKSISAINNALFDFLRLENPTVKTVLKNERTIIKIVATADSDEMANGILSDTSDNIQMILGDIVYSQSDSKIENAVVNRLIEQKITVSTAESCTAGLLSSKITAVANSSSIFEIGISAYSKRIKNAALGVENATLEKYGAVSPQTAAEMATGIRELSGSDIGLSVTGVAGPSTSEGKPIGLVYIALADREKVWVLKLNIGENFTREQIRQTTCFEILDLARRYLYCKNPPLEGGTPIGTPLNVLYEQPHYIKINGLAPNFSSESESRFLRPIITDTPDTQEEISNISQTYDSFKTEVILSNAKTNSQEFVLDDDTDDNSDFENGFKVSFPDFSKSESDIKKSGISSYFKEKFSKLKEKFQNKTFVKKFALNGMIALLIVAVVSVTAYVGIYFKSASKNNELISTLKSSWKQNDIRDISGKYIAFSPLQEINPDITAWITIAGSEIDLPICVNKDGYYSNHNYLSKLSRYGAIYFDKSCTVSKNKVSQNLIVYGNNTGDGTMFSYLSELKNIKSAKQTPVITLTTQYDEFDYQIFAVMTVASDPDDDNGVLFKYNKTYFSSKEEFDLWIAEVRLRSIIGSKLPVEYGTELITLVTDSNDFKGAKTVVVAAKTDLSDQNTNSELFVNQSTRYPQIWYDLHNARNPYAGYIVRLDTESSESNISSAESETSSDLSEPSESSSQPTETDRPATPSRPTVSKPSESKPTPSVPESSPSSATSSDNSDGNNSSESSENSSSENSSSSSDVSSGTSSSKPSEGSESENNGTHESE